MPWRYGVATLCWSALTVAFAIAMSLRYYHRLISVAAHAVVLTLLAAYGGADTAMRAYARTVPALGG